MNQKLITSSQAASLAILLSALGLRAGTLTNIYSFPSQSSPYGGLVQADNGLLYGTTYSGGAKNYGSIFSINIATNAAEPGLFTVSTLYSFLNASDGAHPRSSLIQGVDGALYGTASGGNSASGTGGGTVFRITTNGVFTKLHAFDGSDGGYPYSGLVQAPDGSLYGTTAYYGSYYGGVIFRVTTNGSFSTEYDFTGGSDGAYPFAGLLLGSDGYLYGTTVEGGAYVANNSSINYGTVFQFTPGQAPNTLWSFSGSADAVYPFSPLVEGTNGNLYGLTAGTVDFFGGTSVPLGYGNVFEISPGPNLATIVSFSGGSGGAYPYGGLCQASDGNFYGTTTGYSVNNSGTFFIMAPDGTLLAQLAFNGGNGGNPYGGLVQAMDGNIYGTTMGGGSSDGGAIFEYTLTNAPPFIIVPAQSQTATNGDSVSFRVVAGGTGALTYQWQSNGTNLVDGSNVFGATSNVLTLTDISPEQHGNYAVVVSSEFGQVVSSNAYLSVISIKPTITISHPSSNQKLTNASFTVTGTAKCKLPLSEILFQFNNSGWTNALTTNGWTNWFAPVTLTPGSNYLQAYAVNSTGDFSSTNKVKFWYILNAPITVSTNGFGKVSPNYNGKQLSINLTYTMTAHPGHGFAFTNWTGSITSNNPKLTFVMNSNLTYTANFVDASAPTLTILSPKNHEKWTNAVLTAEGKAKDNVAVAEVYYNLNNTGWTNAVTTNAWTNWTAALNLTQETNHFEAYAVDTQGNPSRTNQVQFLYLVP